ncbi:C3a anaphylatoxin chemotactic receptor-like [Myxocyprinus asiaticus]|uniref:C3a anaphylatoxin chemotactic receptor-like n=1 Tax=Myxocyprinus asiaticus TaxID=70543 RepID=UPI0022235FB3|nr:C3a anaphylatoxin chemotactic receptor-like [Myxocyprinus asiaticus]
MGKDYESLEHSIKVTSQVVYYLMFLLGVPGNVFVVYIAGMKMKRTVNTIWFLNLAIADLLCCLSSLFYVARNFFDNNWPFGSVMCKILPLGQSPWSNLELSALLKDTVEVAVGIEPATFCLPVQCFSPLRHQQFSVAGCVYVNMEHVKFSVQKHLL